MKLQDFDYPLPRRRIAQQPAPARDQARLMVLDRRTGSMDHRLFSDLPQYLEPADAVVINETKVLPARLLGKKPSGGKVEILLVRKGGRGEARTSSTGPAEERKEENVEDWECLVQGSRKLGPKTRVLLDEGLCGELGERIDTGLWKLRLKGKGELDPVLARIGFPPLPPYIRRNGDRKMRAQDLDRYQTVYARKEGAIAAPTAGLHFTEALLDEIKGKGVRILALTLHVGIGTFLPVKQEEVEKHRLEPEFFEVSPETAEAVHEVRASGKRVIAVGTTVTRALESCVDENGTIQPKREETGLFILPGHRFRAVDGLITNFHLPCSTLLMLVSAFAGREFILAAYEEAIRRNYRFYSYGDAMLIL
ncbi:MAG: tRNA preQ1(34) S-adenosylmethionine ribosyltransferase-isomerase QueA [Thermodesulfobacteriota bacterium]